MVQSGGGSGVRAEREGPASFPVPGSLFTRAAASSVGRTYLTFLRTDLS